MCTRSLARFPLGILRLRVCILYPQCLGFAVIFLFNVRVHCCRVNIYGSRRGNGLWKIQIQLDFFLLDFVGLDYFGCG
jgi:hypothetical protein